MHVLLAELYDKLKLWHTVYIHCKYIWNENLSRQNYISGNVR